MDKYELIYLQELIDKIDRSNLYFHYNSCYEVCEMLNEFGVKLKRLLSKYEKEKNKR